MKYRRTSYPDRRAKLGAAGKCKKSYIMVWLITLAIGISILIPGCAEESNSPKLTPVPQVQTFSQKRKPIELSLVSFAVTRAAYTEIVPLFKQKWLEEHNQEVRFRLSFAGSSTQTKAVINGLPADVVHLALALDTNKIQKAGLIAPGWEEKVPNNGIVTQTVAAIVTREGNPKQVYTWLDLAKPGVSIITADPKTSGIARWNFLAFWGVITQTGGTEAEALDFTTAVFRNVKVLAKDAREATDLFLRQNQGDVLINYENELLVATREGLAKDTFVVIPDVNISIDNPIAVVDKYVERRGSREVAEAFVNFLYTPEAQRAFAKVGFRPLNSQVAQELSGKFPRVSKLFTVEAFGGWNAIQDKFFKDDGVFDRIQAQIRARRS